MSDKSKFVGQPKSALDFGWMKRVAKRLDALLNGQIVTTANGAGEVKYADGNTTWVIPRGGGTPTSTANWNYRGLFMATPPTPYMTFDVVQLGSGTAAGMYLSTIDNNTNSPDTGIGWTQVSSSSGTWL